MRELDEAEEQIVHVVGMVKNRPDLVRKSDVESLDQVANKAFDWLDRLIQRGSLSRRLLSIVKGLGIPGENIPRDLTLLPGDLQERIVKEPKGELLGVCEESAKLPPIRITQEDILEMLHDRDENPMKDQIRSERIPTPHRISPRPIIEFEE